MKTFLTIFLSDPFRALFPKSAHRANSERASRLRADNRVMQQALKDWNRCDDCARYLDRNVRYLDDVPDWDID